MDQAVQRRGDGNGSADASLPSPDFRALFNALPGLYLVLLPNDPAFTIVGVNAAFAAATVTKPEQILGRNLFEVFPDNPNDPDASGTQNLRASLRRVIATNAPDALAVQRYDIRGPGESAEFEERYWSAINTPLPDADGRLEFIIQRAEDVTELVRLKSIGALQEKLTGELRERAGKMEAELFLRNRQLAESKRLIEAREEAEAKLVANEVRLAMAFAEAPIGMVLLTPDGVILEVNQAFLDMLGYTRQELEERDSGTYTHPDDIEPTRALFASMRHSMQKISVLEKRYLRKDGKVLWARASVNMRRDDQGRPQQVVAIVEDITERKQAQAALGESEGRFRAAVDANSSILWTNNARGEMEGEQPGWGSFTGQTQEEYRGYGWAMAVHPDDARPTIDAWNQAVAERRLFVFEHRLRRRDGVWRLFSIRAVPVFDVAGEIREWVGVHSDITEERALIDALRQSEARFRQVIDSMPQLVWSTQPDGYHDLYNKRWYEYTGRSPDGGTGAAVPAFHPEDRPKAWEQWRHSVATGEPYQIEYRCRRYDGQFRWFLGRATPIRDERGNIVRWFGTCTDIHEQKESEEALLRANRELEEFAYVASHDLQEPLRVVNIYTQLIVKHVQENPEMTKFAGFVNTGVMRMEKLIQDLLTFSRTAHEDSNQPAPTDLAASLAEALSVMKSRIDETSAAIQVHPLPVVNGDVAQLSHVFQNLISNSLKYRKPGQAPKIEISALQDGDRWVISVHDDGLGFDQQYSERIFGLFKRLHKDEYPGTGLGLAICKRIVERFGGRIWAESAAGQGATFRFSLIAGSR